ncbi:hypothetical protein C8R44DRAFT_725777 [Mycena epipterygia]|nr:hypothetical protein C8R44DRAFT_725777 [Mycena epipterygia]
MSRKDLPDSTLAMFTKPRRVYIACLNCRKRKIKCVTTEESPDKPCERCAKRGLTCEYVSVGDQEFPSPTSTQSGRGGPPMTQAQSVPPPRYGPNTWGQSPPAYGGNNPGGATPYPYNPHSNSPYLNSPPPMPQTDPYHSSRGQHGATPQYPAYNHPAMTAGPSHAPQAQPYPTAGFPQHQPPPVHGSYNQYGQYFPNPSPGPNNMFYPTNTYNSRCTCPPTGACFCGAR